MNTNKYLKILQKEIHSTAFATIGTDGHPQVRMIDIMLVDDDSVYFITAKGKDFYRQLIEQEFVAVTGTTLDKRAISLRGKVRKANPSLLEQVFCENPYMCDIYPDNTRSALEVFQIFEGQGEFFDLSVKPIFRETFVIGNAEIIKSNYIITDVCISCGNCLRHCPQICILKGNPYTIKQENCLHCGRCHEVCPVKAVEKVVK